MKIKDYSAYAQSFHCLRVTFADDNISFSEALEDYADDYGETVPIVLGSLVEGGPEQSEVWLSPAALNETMAWLEIASRYIDNAEFTETTFEVIKETPEDVLARRREKPIPLMDAAGTIYRWASPAEVFEDERLRGLEDVHPGNIKDIRYLLDCEGDDELGACVALRRLQRARNSTGEDGWRSILLGWLNSSNDFDTNLQEYIEEFEHEPDDSQ